MRHVSLYILNISLKMPPAKTKILFVTKYVPHNHPTRNDGWHALAHDARDRLADSGAVS